MASAESVLEAILREVEPTPTQKEGARRSHNYLRDLLRNGGQIGRRIIDDYLSGSYARDTAVQPLNDVDIIFEIDPDAWDKSLLSSDPKPDAVLSTFLNAIRYRYKGTSLRRQRRSVRLIMYHLNIDVVPAIADDEDPEVIRIPDVENKGWLRSAPKRHSLNATSINKRRGGLFKPLVKLLKNWNANLPESSARLKSFTIETMAVRIFSKTHFPSLEQGVLRYWDFLVHQTGEPTVYTWRENFGIVLSGWGRSVPDATQIGGNTLGSTSEERCSSFLKYARRSRDTFLQALDARSQHRTDELVRKALRC